MALIPPLNMVNWMLEDIHAELLPPPLSAAGAEDRQRARLEAAQERRGAVLRERERRERERGKERERGERGREGKREREGEGGREREGDGDRVPPSYTMSSVPAPPALPCLAPPRPACTTLPAVEPGSDVTYYNITYYDTIL